MHALSAPSGFGLKAMALVMGLVMFQDLAMRPRCGGKKERLFWLRRPLGRLGGGRVMLYRLKSCPRCAGDLVLDGDE